MAKRRAEEERLKLLCERTLEKYGKYQQLEIYKELLKEFDEFCDDEIHCC